MGETECRAPGSILAVPIARIVATDVRSVQRVEQICCESDGFRSADIVQVLSNTEIHVLVWENPRNREASPLIVFAAETRRTADILLVLPAEGSNPRQLNAP